jgi:hypothetical protein
MNKRQVIQWCHGQYAAAYFSARRSAPKPTGLTIAERIDRCHSLPLDYMKRTFRMVFLYDGGRRSIHPSRVSVIRGKHIIHFRTGGLTPQELEGLKGLRGVAIRDDEGVVLDWQPVVRIASREELFSGEELFATELRAAIWGLTVIFVLDKRKLNVKDFR